MQQPNSHINTAITILILLLVLISSIDTFLNNFVSLRGFSQANEISIADHNFSKLLPHIKKQDRVGYISERSLFHPKAEDLTYRKAQYSLSPVVLVPNNLGGITIGNFEDDPSDLFEKYDLTIVKLFDHGNYLLKKNSTR